MRHRLFLLSFAVASAGVLGMHRPVAEPMHREVGRTGAITTLHGDVRWHHGRVSMAGTVVLAAGSSLTIAPGTIVEAQPGARLVIPRDSRIDAQGTLLQPIVFRCAGSQVSGCWRGVVIDGFAPVNRGPATSPPARGAGAAGCRELAGDGDPFGGCDPVDSSGALAYVRVERAADGLVLRGVGRATVLRHLQVHEALGSGLTVIGGTARLRYVFLTLNAQFGLAWRTGWQGDAQFVVVQQNPSRSAGGLFGANGESEAEANATPRSAPTLTNVTLITESGAGNPYAAQPPRAIVLERGTAVMIRNVLVARAPVGLDVDGAVSCQLLSSGGISIANGLWLSTGNVGDPDADPTACAVVGPSPLAEQAHVTRIGSGILVNASASAAGAALASDQSLTLPDVRTRSSATDVSAVASAPPSGFDFEPASYAAGVEPANAPRSNIPWYSGWTIGGASPPPAPSTLVVRVQSALLGDVRNQRVVLLPAGIAGLTGTNGVRAFEGVPTGPVTIALEGLPVGCAPAPAVDRFLASASVDTVAVQLACVPAPEAALDAGFSHTCGLDRDGRAFCWGAGGEGQLGTGTRDSTTIPTPVSGDRTYVQLSVANHATCAIDPTRVLWCWGSNAQGQLGIAAGIVRALVPTAVGGALRFLQVSAGAEHTCGIAEDERAYCWGSGNDGKLGTGGFSAQPTPALVSGDLRWQSIAAGGAHSCGVTTAGVPHCWGTSVTGALGTSTILQSAVPVPVDVPTGVVFREVVTGESQSCAISTAGLAWCWGTNVVGQLGDGSGTNRPVPTPVSGGVTWAAIGMGAEPSILGHVCGVDVASVLRCWGLNDEGQLGRDVSGSCFYLQLWPCAITPQSVPAVGPVGRAVSGGRHSCALTLTGSVWCWGRNSSGQLGDGTRTSRMAPALTGGQVTWPSPPVP